MKHDDRGALIQGLLAWLPALLLICCVPSPAAAQGAAQSWDNLVAAAQREGRVVVIGPPDSEVRKMLPAAFKARFGITVEYLGGRSSEQAARLRAERSSGLYTVDATLSGIGSMATIFHREKMLAPLRPELILPEVVNGLKWKKGELWFSDPEQQYVLRLSNYLLSSFYINTRWVNPNEIRSGRDLLDPKWTGKISASDPSLLGGGVNTAVKIFLTFGEDGVKKLYVDQKPAFSRDTRQMTDWLLRGNYPIAFDVDEDQVEKLQEEGMPVMAIYDLPDLPASLTAGFGLLALFNHAPHQEAAKLFANWIASREGLEIWARATKTAPTRNDIDEARFLPAAIIPQPGGIYLDTYDWEFAVNTREKVRQHMKDLLGR